MTAKRKHVQLINSPTNEFGLLTCLSRTILRDSDEEFARSLLREGINWDVFLGSVQYHNLLPLVDRHFSHIEEPSIPTYVYEFLQHRMRTLSFKSQFLVAELSRVFSHLTAHGIQAISIKGPVLAYAAYGSLGLRQYGDLDVVVPTRHIHRIGEVLSEIGYELHPELASSSQWVRRWRILIGSQVSYVRGRQFFNLDIHTHVMPLHFRFRPDAAELIQRSTTLDLGAEAFSFPEPELMLQILCFHGHKNRWETLKYVCDVAELVHSFPNLDFGSVIDEAKSRGGYEILLIGLSLANRVLDAPVPELVHSNLRVHKAVQVTVNSILERLPHQYILGTVGFKDRIRLQFSTHGSIRAKARYASVAGLRRTMVWNKDAVAN